MGREKEGKGGEKGKKGESPKRAKKNGREGPIIVLTIAPSFLAIDDFWFISSVPTGNRH